MRLASTDLDTADAARGQLGSTVIAADVPETRRRWETSNDWWEEIETVIETRVTDARTAVADTGIEPTKRAGRGSRNHHDRRRMRRRRHRQPRRRRTRLNRQATAANCE
jgi:hypothetical protein